MGNFLVSSVCRAHSRSEAVYAIVRAQVSALRGRQQRGSPLQRRCAAQQAALLRALSSKMTLTAAVMKCWASAATARAKAALITSLVFIAKRIISSTTPQLTSPQNDEYDVFDEFNAVIETAPRPTKSIREQQHSAKLEAKSLELEEQQAETNLTKTLESGDNLIVDDYDNETDTNQFSDLDDDFEMLPKLEEDHAFYADLDSNQTESHGSQTEGERLLQLASSISDSSMHVEEFILSGKHDNFEAITKDVDQLAAESSESEKRSVVRILLAYYAYSKDSNYSSGMVRTAEECLRVWQGDEDRAFKSLSVLCSDVPRLCAALE